MTVACTDGLIETAGMVPEAACGFLSPPAGTLCGSDERRTVDFQAWADQEGARLTNAIRSVGWAIQYVGGDTCGAPGCDCTGDSDGQGEPPFAYTVGLFGLNHPELLIFGIDPGTAVRVLNDLGARVRAGDAVMPQLPVEVDGWSHRIIPEVVPNAGEIVFGANRYYCRPDEHSVPVLQLSYDDVEGRFPWEAGHLEPWLQPRPGTFRA